MAEQKENKTAKVSGKKNIGNDKKRLLTVLEIMKRTDDEHPLTKNQILDKVAEKGVEVNNLKTIAADLAALKELGYDIVTDYVGNYMAGGQLFENYELKMLADHIANARYLLMSTALSQKLKSDIPVIHRFMTAYCVTDEIFGLSVAVDGYLNPVYTYGITLVSVAGWTCGTALGVLVGNILPEWASNAMSVSLYGMFLAIIIPPARKNSFIGLLVALSMAVSFLFSLLPVLSSISSGFKVIILTLVIAGAAAWIRPVEEEKT